MKPYLSFSIKSKSVIFVVVLISILFFILYYHNKASQKSYLHEIHNQYIKSFHNYYDSFKSNMLKYYSVQAVFFDNKKTYDDIQKGDTVALMKQVSLIFNNLKPSNRYLKDISFITANYKWKIQKQEIHFDKNLLSTYKTLFGKINSRNRNIVDLLIQNNEVYYRLLSGIFFGDELIGAVEFLIDAQILLKSINSFDGSKGFLFFLAEDKTFQKCTYLESESFLQKQKIDIQTINNNKIIKTNDKYFAIKIFPLYNVNHALVAKSIFFLDVTDKNISYKNSLKQSIYISLALLILATFIVNHIFQYLIAKIEVSEEKLKVLNKNLEKKVEEETHKRVSIQLKAIEEKKEKQQLLINQSKLASMGEMIANIAHQWRQPLMQMSSVFMMLEAYQEKNKLSKEVLIGKIKEGKNLINFMSMTIEDFRNFYRADKKKEAFLLEEALKNALTIVNASLSSHNIYVEINIDKPKIIVCGYKNEFSQALLNIISNAKDILVQKAVKNPQITIDIFTQGNQNIIKISDNAGGIDKKILHKIFNPYFTTKKAHSGTGIGLYITKIIIEKNMQGKLEVSNSSKGACFAISVNKGAL